MAEDRATGGKKEMTNLERIKQMSSEVLAVLICDTHVRCSECRFWNRHAEEKKQCEQGSAIKNWLESDSVRF